VTHFTFDLGTAKSFALQHKTMKTTPEQNKRLILEAFDTLFNKRDYGSGEILVTELYPAQRAHSPGPGRFVQLD
jgi:hypothetical protein